MNHIVVGATPGTEAHVMFDQKCPEVEGNGKVMSCICTHRIKTQPKVHPKIQYLS